MALVRSPRRSWRLTSHVRIDGWAWLLFPAFVLLAGLFAYPLTFIASESLPNWRLDNYARVFRTFVYVNVLWTTFEIAALVTLICVVLGYPYAYMLTNAKGALRMVLVTALLVPFWVSVLLRTFSWLMLLQDTGIINRGLLAAGLIDHPLPLIRNFFSVSVAMVHVLLPYMILPIMAVMRGIPPTLLEAASICGSSPLRQFLRIYLPLTLPGVLAGAVLTLTLSLGFYITPAILGGARNTMIAQLIADQINKQVNFTFSAALAMVLIGATTIVFMVLGLLWRITRHNVGTR